MAGNDHRFCRNDTPDYNQVAAGDPDALGYDRKETQIGSCNTTDHDWRPNDTTTGWSAWSDTCSSTANSTRVVSCYRRFDNKLVQDSACNAATKPATSKTEAVYTSCSYDYVGGTAADWGAWSSTCSNNATRSRNPQCRRSNGEIVADSFCTAAGKTKPTTSETQGVYSSCTYSAGGTTTNGAWSSQCSANATRSVTRQCIRSTGDVVPDTECSNRSIALTSTETKPVYDQCGYAFTSGTWSAWDNTCTNSATRTRSVNCRRSDGTDVADSECTSRGSAKPATSEQQAVYTSCSYAAGGSTTYGAWSSQCSANAQRSVTRQCIRSNGDVVASTECTNRGVAIGSTQTAAVYDQCGYSFSTGGWSDWNSHCSASAIRTRTVQCLRSDGTPVSDAECTNRGVGRPTSSETAAVYDQCGYSAGGTTTYGAWSSQCSANAQRSVNRQCIRADGAVVANAECTNRGIAVTSTQTAAVYDQCGYSFATGGWSDWNSHCSANATRTRVVQCQRADGASVADAECTNRGVGRPASSETTAVYDQCGYTRGDYTNSSDWNSHCSANAVRTNYYNCKRADGTVVDSSLCTSRGIAVTEQQGGAVYDGCGYSFVPGAWSDWSSHCSANARRNRAVWCYRSDGTMMDPNHQPCYNAGQTYPGFEEYAAVYDGCGFARGDYTGSTDWNSHCSGSAVRTNNYNCKRSDGTVVANAECTNRGISVADQEGGAVYDQCGYAAVNWTGFSACSGGTQTRTAQCQRSDGAIVANSECDNRGQATTQSQACASSCGWQKGSATQGGGVPACGPTNGWNGARLATGEVSCTAGPGYPFPSNASPAIWFACNSSRQNVQAMVVTAVSPNAGVLWTCRCN